MEIVKLSDESIPAFKEFFGKYSALQDESYPPLENYSATDDEPGFLLMENNSVTGAAVLMMHQPYREAGSARFRMFYCVSGDVKHYRALLDNIIPCAKGLKSIYCFVQDTQPQIWQPWEQLGFEAKRFAWILERSLENIPELSFPAGMEPRVFRKDIDSPHWCHIINDAFEKTFGHTRMTPEKIEQLRLEPGYLPGGMFLLWDGDEPVGTIQMTKDEAEGEVMIFIDAIGVVSSHQGRGLGRGLLRFGIQFAVEYGAKKVMLSVNAENDKAARLYFDEGFVKESLYKSYYLNLNSI
jgi:mycothiol synthase